MTDPYHVFLSYSRNDLEAAINFHGQLGQHVGRNEPRELRRMSVFMAQSLRGNTSRPIRRVNALGHQTVKAVG